MCPVRYLKNIIVYYSIGLKESVLKFWWQISKSGGCGALLIGRKISSYILFNVSNWRYQTSNLEKKFLHCNIFRGVGSVQYKTSFVYFRVKSAGGNKNIIQRKRETILKCRLFQQWFCKSFFYFNIGYGLGIVEVGSNKVDKAQPVLLV